LLQNCVSEEQVLASFLSSDEYFARHGKSSARWLEQVYKELLGRKPDDFSKPRLFALKRKAATRNKLLLALVSSPEYRAHRIQRLYMTYLGRPATVPEMASWTHVLRHEATEGQMRAA
jgi:Domain of unknown function (DUF4214)